MTSIGSHAFSDCDGLTSVTIGIGVTSIGDNAFWDCGGLESVVWNAANCTKAGSFSSSDSGTTVYSIFGGRTHISTVTFGATVKTVPIYAFGWCQELTTIHYNGTIDGWKSIHWEYKWNVQTGNYIVYCTDGTISKNGTEHRN